MVERPAGTYSRSPSTADLPASWRPEDHEILTISAERGDGIEALAAEIASRLVPDPPSPGAGVPFRPGQVRRIDQAGRDLRAGDLASAARHFGALLATLPRRSGQSH